MKELTYHSDIINIYDYTEAEDLIARLANDHAGDITPVATGGRGRNRIEYYNYPCSFDIETTTIKPGQLDYPYDPEAAPVAFPYLFQFCIYGYVIMVRTYEQAMDVFKWCAEYFRTGGNRRLVFFDHNLGYEEHFFRGLWKIVPDKCFALDDHHPVTIVTKDGLMFRDSYKMTNMSLATLTKDWSRKWIKDKEIMDYSQLRTPYTPLDDNTLIYSALDVLSLSDAIIPFLAARNEFIWTKCPTSTSFIRKGLKKAVGVGIKGRTEEQKAYHKMLKSQHITFEMYEMLKRQARGGNTHANRAITGKLLTDLCHFDITSSYPAQMVCYPEYPLGQWFDLDPGTDPELMMDFEADGQCTLFDVVLENCRLKPGVTVPYIPISKMVIVDGSGMKYTDNGRYIEGLHLIQVTVFGIEWPIIKRQYDFDDAIITKGYFCDKGYLPGIVRQFILDLYQKKTELKGIENMKVEYMLNKIACNSVYGVAFTDPIRQAWEFTEEGIMPKSEQDPEAFLEDYQNSVSYFMQYAVGCMVSTLGRVYLQKMIDACYIDPDDMSKGSDFCYCDTDSIFATNPDIVRPKIRALEQDLTSYQRKCGLELTYYDIEGRPHELGGIDEEPACEYFKTYGAKKYITVEDGKLTCTIAGVPKKAGSRLIGSPDNFQLGFNFRGADTGKQCLWYNPPLGYDLHENGRPIHVYYNVAMLPCDYLLSLSSDYTECLSIEGNFHWQFKEADSNTLNEEDL